MTFPAFQTKPDKRPTYAEKTKLGLVSPKPRKRVKKISKKRSEWLDKYHVKIDLDEVNQECFRCHIQGTKHSLDRHHTHGRNKELILRYSYCCSTCHTWIHEHPNQARKGGYLFF